MAGYPGIIIKLGDFKTQKLSFVALGFLLYGKKDFDEKWIKFWRFANPLSRVKSPYRRLRRFSLAATFFKVKEVSFLFIWPITWGYSNFVFEKCNESVFGFCLQELFFVYCHNRVKFTSVVTHHCLTVRRRDNKKEPEKCLFPVLMTGCHQIPSLSLCRMSCFWFSFHFILCDVYYI